jgi:hypothetical protein
MIGRTTKRNTLQRRDTLPVLILETYLKINCNSSLKFALVKESYATERWIEPLVFKKELSVRRSQDANRF